MNANIIQTQLINVLFEKGLSYSTIKKVYNALNNFFKYLLIRDIVTKSPMLGVVLPAISKFSKSSRHPKCLTADEIERFKRQALRKTNNGKYMYRYGFIYVFMLYTGLRCGEMLGLQWKHIDFEKKVLYVRQSLITIKNDSNNGTRYITKLQDTTKTLSGERTVPLCQTAIDAIKAHMDLFYNGDKESFVVTSAKGNLLRTRHFERSANCIFKAAGIHAGGVHILRHTFASMLFDKSVDIKYISRLLGHSDVSTTYNTYIHLTSENISNEVNKLD